MNIRDVVFSVALATCIFVICFLGLTCIVFFNANVAMREEVGEIRDKYKRQLEVYKNQLDDEREKNRRYREILSRRTPD